MDIREEVLEERVVLPANGQRGFERVDDHHPFCLANIDVAGDHPLSRLPGEVEPGAAQRSDELPEAVPVHEVFDVLVDFLERKRVEDGRCDDDRDVLLDDDDRVGGQLLGTR